MPTQSFELLSAHHLAYRVMNIIEKAKDYCVLVTAYVKLWPHLELALRQAVERGVKVIVLIRAEDGSSREREKRKGEIRKLADLGIDVQEIERLHAKVYMNEAEAILTSFNLVDGSQDSVELGIVLPDPAVVAECLKHLEQWLPGLTKHLVRGPKSGKPAAAPQGASSGYCIGCATPQESFDPLKPLCRDCYKESDRGKTVAKLPKRVCHSCGEPTETTLKKPLCYGCYKRLPDDVKAALAG